MQTTDARLFPAATAPPNWVASAPALDAVLAMTREVFPGEVDAQLKTDPEIANETYYVIHAHARGSAAEIAALDSLWHQRLLETASEPVGLYRLALDVQ